MSDFCFNGTWGADLGLTFNTLPQGGRGAQRYTSATVPGRDSMIYRVENAYEDYNDQIVVNCMGNSPRIVFNWLRGSGWATISDNPTRRRWVRFADEASIERWRVGYEINDIVSMPMVCEAFSYNIADPVVTLTNGQTFRGEGDWYARPLLHVAGSGDIIVVVNDTTFQITAESSQTVHIDADAKLAYVVVNGENQSAALNGVTVTLMSEDPDTRWGRLNYKGENTISWEGSNVQSVSLHPRWRWF